MTCIQYAMKNFTIVVATDSELGIGKTGALPWRLKEDMKHFRELTTSGGGANSVIMGRKTWESIPEKFRPLPGRTNIVLSRSSVPAGAITLGSLDAALEVPADRKFVIGGGQIYAEAIDHPACTELIVTKVDKSFDCDVFFPRYEDNFQLDSVISRFVESGIDCSVERWLRR
jgi:dihydrofolate reductase